MAIEENLRQVQDRIARAAERVGRLPQDVILIAVTKSVGLSAIEAAYQAGISHFGENRVQEAKPKAEQLATRQPKLTWHMVGHLQTNKIKTAIQIFDIIHSIDSLRLAEALSRRLTAPLPVLVQVNVAGEATKNGFPVAAVMEVAEQIGRLHWLELKGLMAVAPMVRDGEEVRPFFRKLRQLRDAIGLAELSMGMSDDFEVAVEEGSTMVRIGRVLFGERGLA